MTALLLAMAAAHDVASAAASRFAIPATAEQLIVASSPTADPPAPGYLTTLRTYERTSASQPSRSPASATSWRQLFGPWQAETGRGHLIATRLRREGDGTTPIGVFGIGATIYGNRLRPRGLHYAYHRLACGDWWDEDPYSRLYNRFVHVPCGVTPAFAPWSEALWTDSRAYPYFAVLRFNMNPVRRGPRAPGSGIFLHNWVAGPTNGCIALRKDQLLELLRWLRPSAHPVIEIGTNVQVSPRLRRP